MTFGSGLSKIKLHDSEVKTMTLKEMREATGLSVQEAAKVLGFPVKTWESWENGDRSPAPFIEKQIIEKLNKMRK